MSKYRLTEEEQQKLLELYSESEDHRLNFMDGLNSEYCRLIPLLEEKDAAIEQWREMTAGWAEEIKEKNQLLRDCREYLEAVERDFDLDVKTKELLTKLKDI